MNEDKLPALPFLVFLPAFLQSFAWPFAHIIFRLFGKLQVSGKENLKSLKKGVIIAANHTHEMDPILMRAIFPMFSKHSPMYYVARQRRCYTWKGWRSFVYSETFFNAWGAYPAYKGSKDYKTSLRHFVDFGKENHTICIFPAGLHKSPPEDVTEVKGGLGYLAHVTGLPVVPVRIDGLVGVTWKDLFTYKIKIIITIGEPMVFSKYNPSPPIEKCKETSEIVWTHILKLNKNINNI